MKDTDLCLYHDKIRNDLEKNLNQNVNQLLTQTISLTTDNQT